MFGVFGGISVLDVVWSVSMDLSMSQNLETVPAELLCLMSVRCCRTAEFFLLFYPDWP